MTGLWLGAYYRTYPVTVQDEVVAALARPEDFSAGPLLFGREGPERRDYGFTVRDRNYLSGRYYIDAYRFADDFVTLVSEHDGEPTSR